MVSGVIENISGDLSELVSVSGIQGITTITSTETQLDNSIQVYPNPITNKLYISLSTGHYKILDLRGIIKHQGIITVKPIDLKSLESSIYLLRIESEETIKNLRLIKE